jgi:hypothetical protein
MSLLDAWTLKALAAFPLALEQCFASIPKAFEKWEPEDWDGIPSETLSPLGQICHVRDIEIEGYQLRFKRTLAEVKPFLPGLDFDQLTISNDYRNADAETALHSFTNARTQTMAMLSALSEADLNRPAVFDGYGDVTLRAMVHYLCSHDQQHLAGLQWLAGKIATQKAAA